MTRWERLANEVRSVAPSISGVEYDGNLEEWRRQVEVFTEETLKAKIPMHATTFASSDMFRTKYLMVCKEEPGDTYAFWWQRKGDSDEFEGTMPEIVIERREVSARGRCELRRKHHSGSV